MINSAGLMVGNSGECVRQSGLWVNTIEFGGFC